MVSQRRNRESMLLRSHVFTSSTRQIVNLYPEQEYRQALQNSIFF